MRVKPFLSFLVLLFLGVTLILLVTIQQNQEIRQQAATRLYHVVGNTILDPNGNRFLIKGVGDRLGNWLSLPDGGYGDLTYEYGQRDMNAMKGMGINYIRVWVNAAHVGQSNWYKKLDMVVQWATQRGLVLELTNGMDGGITPGSDEANITNRFLQYLANHYKNHPNVWLQPINEPTVSWTDWHRLWTQWIQTIRSQGFQNPIVVNTPDWSGCLCNVNNPSKGIDTPQFALIDNNLVYAVHAYSWQDNFDQSTDAGMSKYGGKYAVIFDEFGPEWKQQYINFTWLRNFLTYNVNQINKGIGQGVAAQLWFWSDGNSIVNQDTGAYQQGINLTQYGKDYKAWYLDTVPETQLLTSPTPTHPILPTSGTPTPSTPPSSARIPTSAPTATPITQPSPSSTIPTRTTGGVFSLRSHGLGNCGNNANSQSYGLLGDIYHYANIHEPRV